MLFQLAPIDERVTQVLLTQADEYYAKISKRKQPHSKKPVQWDFNASNEDVPKTEKRKIAAKNAAEGDKDDLDDFGLPEQDC